VSKVTNYSSPFQSHYNKTNSYSLSFPPNSRWTKQSFKDECDINTIMARYQSTGEIPVINERAPQYLDVSSGFDFASMQAQIVQAQSLFNDLPSTLRNRFSNDPGAFLAYCQDESNHEEMRKLGLLKEKATAGTAEPPISDASSTSSSSS